MCEFTGVFKSALTVPMNLRAITICGATFIDCPGVIALSRDDGSYLRMTHTLLRTCVNPSGSLISINPISSCAIDHVCFSQSCGNSIGAVFLARIVDQGSASNSLCYTSCVVSTGLSQSRRTVYLDFGTIEAKNDNMSLIQSAASVASMVLFTTTASGNVASFVSVTNCSGETVFDALGVDPTNIFIIHNRATFATIGCFNEHETTYSSCIIRDNNSPMLVGVYVEGSGELGLTKFHDCYFDSYFIHGSVSYGGCHLKSTSPPRFTNDGFRECSLGASFTYTAMNHSQCKMYFILVIGWFTFAFYYK